MGGGRGGSSKRTLGGLCRTTPPEMPKRPELGAPKACVGLLPLVSRTRQTASRHDRVIRGHCPNDWYTDEGRLFNALHDRPLQ